MSPIRVVQRGFLTYTDNTDLLRRVGLFDASFYLNQYPDVTSSNLDPLIHYMQHGAQEGRDPHPLFDTTYYVTTNPDVVASGLNPLIHYILHGARAKRDPHPLFDTAYYLEQKPQLTSADLIPLVHYMQHGADGGRDPHPLFQSQYYLEKNPDIAASGVSPLVHYILHGWQARLDPHPLFDTTFYLQQYPDVLESGVNPLKHYVQHGQSEERLSRNIFFDAVTHPLTKFYPSLREIEPLLPTLEELTKLFLSNSLKDSLAGDAYFKLASILDRPFSHLVLAGNLDASHWRSCALIDSLVGKHGADSLLVLAPDPASGSFNEAVTEEIPLSIRFIGAEHLPKELTLFQRMMIVLRLILQAAPEAVHNCKSELGAIIFREYVLQLQHVTRLIDCTSPPSVDVPQRSLAGSQAAEQTANTSCSSDTTSDAPSFDISLVITCHGEGSLLLKTISAACLAVEYARNAKLTVEWLFVLDRADEATRRCLEEQIPVDARSIETDLGDPGQARNAGALEARGDFVAFMDGDDMFSPNWLEAAYRFAKTLADKPFILHPLGTIFFGENQLLKLYYDSEDPQYSCTALIEDSAWLTCPFAKRKLYLLHPYRPTDSEKGFGFEDWLWNCDTVAYGIAHKIVPNTFFCYRVKPGLASRNAGAHSCILGTSKLFDLKFQSG